MQHGRWDDARARARRLAALGAAGLSAPSVLGLSAVQPANPMAEEDEELLDEDRDGVLEAMAIALPWAISVVFHFAIFVMLWAFGTTNAAELDALAQQQAMAAAVVQTPGDDKPIGVPNPGLAMNDRPTAQDRIKDPTADGFNMYEDSTGLSSYYGRSIAGTGRGEGSDGAGSGLGTGGGRMIGSGAGGGGGGGPLARYGPPGGMGSGPVGFFGSGAGSGKGRVVYLIDRSGSMITTFDIVVREMIRSISALGTGNEFHVVFFASGAPVELDAKRLVPATESNKRIAEAFLDNVTPEGLTVPDKAFERAFQVTNSKGQNAQVIFMLTDGEFDIEAVNLATRLNSRLPTDQRIEINTIAFLSEEGKITLQRLAAENGGKYRFVSRDDIPR